MDHLEGEIINATGISIKVSAIVLYLLGHSSISQLILHSHAQLRRNRLVAASEPTQG
jgi:hypothetical protein